jgi:hypothetical protein
MSVLFKKIENREEICNPRMIIQGAAHRDIVGAPGVPGGVVLFSTLWVIEALIVSGYLVSVQNMDFTERYNEYHTPTETPEGKFPSSSRR